jgi:hypothetical protein
MNNISSNLKPMDGSFGLLDLTYEWRLLTVVVLGVLSLLALRWVLISDPEAPVSYSLTVPEQCRDDWKGEILEEPSIRVRQ